MDERTASLRDGVSNVNIIRLKTVCPFPLQTRSNCREPTGG
jgi:hypothetical protein